MSQQRWMLPEGVEESLAPNAWALEDLRRTLLDHYRQRGYDLILPPLIEHLDALLTGSAQDLEEQTFKLTDPVSGRLLGLRADMTPQAARIAARHFADRSVVRLCYLGTVLRAQSEHVGGSRTPRQVGCEIFGDDRLEADLEALELMLETLSLAGVREAHVDLGHVGVYRAVIESLRLSAEDEGVVFDLVQRKSKPDLQRWLEGMALADQAAEMLLALLDLHGDQSVLDRAATVLSYAGQGVVSALERLSRVADALGQRPEAPSLHLDLAELRGFRYKTGLVFAAFTPGFGRELARGGRYDGVGSAFGSARPATGFSADLNELLRLGGDGHA
jgi:ATP phosphoribosyltransferase regulatory subunit